MRRKIVAVSAGLVIWAILNLFWYLAWVSAGNYFGFPRFALFARLIVPIFKVLGSLVAGLIAGWIVRERGWLYGFLAGLPIFVLTLAMEILRYFAPTLVYGQAYSNVYKPGAFFSYSFLKLLIGLLFYASPTLLIFGFGGWIGEKLYKRRASK